MQSNQLLRVAVERATGPQWLPDVRMRYRTSAETN